jgi:phosphatidylinositol alpha-1,6-mannosyltransferase
MTKEVLIVTPDFPPRTGGIQTLVHGLALSLERYEPRVVTLGSGHYRRFDRAQPFRVDRVPTRPGLRKASLVALNLDGVRKAVQRRPSAILSAHIVTGPGAIVARRALGVPVVQYVHAQELNRRPRLARRVLERVDATIAVSAHSRSLVNALGVFQNVHIVHPGVEALDEDACFDGDREPAIVVVSRLEERYKGHDVLLRAFALVRTRVPSAHLHVVGDGRLRRELEALGRDLGVSDVVTFHGVVSDEERDAVMRRASVFAMLSRVDGGGAGEGFGLVYVEAGRHRLPVVAGRAAGALDAVVDGVTGKLVEPEDYVAAADAIASLLSDPREARRMGEAGQSWARAHSWHRTAVGVESVLDEVVGR